MEAMPMSFMQDPVFRRLGQVAKFAALNDKDKKAYKESLKSYRDSYAIAETERAEGRAEGKNEERRESIRIMLSLGIQPDIIAEKYGITSEEVLGLVKN